MSVLDDRRRGEGPCFPADAYDRHANLEPETNVPELRVYRNVESRFTSIAINGRSDSGRSIGPFAVDVVGTRID
jgi:hypothetical protein